MAPRNLAEHVSRRRVAWSQETLFVLGAQAIPHPRFSEVILGITIIEIIVIIKNNNNDIIHDIIVIYIYIYYIIGGVYPLVN